MDAFLSFAQARQKALIATIRSFAECESPSDDQKAVGRFVELVADTVSGYARTRTLPGGRFGRVLMCEMSLPGRRKSGQILALGHSDTVWPMGTLRTMRFRNADGRLWGPGVLDMKAGIAFFLAAVQALRELDVPVPSKVLLQLNPDEEVGSEVSRELTEKNASRSKAVLVLEPGTGLTGKLKTARKGVGDFTVKVKGRASHAGVDFQAGASAVLELTRQINHIASFTRLDKGITVNPGVVRGGTRSNVVAAEASAEIDIRVLRLRDAPALERRFRSLKPFDKRCTLEVTGGLNRPPMERSAGNRQAVPPGAGTGPGDRSRTRGIAHRRRQRRQLHRGAGCADPGRAGRGRGGRACRQRKYPDRPHGRPHGADRQTDRGNSLGYGMVGASPACFAETRATLDQSISPCPVAIASSRWS